MAVNFGKDKETLFASADLMSFGKAFSRMAAQPLDKDEVWYDKAALEAYALATDKSSYVGQKVVYVDEANQKVYQYSIEFDGSLKEIGTAPIGDTKSIVVADNGTVSLKGIDSLSFTDEEGNEVNFQPLMTKDGLVWVQPSKTTVEGLASLIDGLTQRVGTLETSVGKAAEGENAATGLFKAIADETARAQAAEKANADAIALLTENLTTEEIDSVKELVDYVNEHGTEVSGMKDDIKANADDIDALETNKADKATTLAGYGITDAYTKAEADKAIADKVADVTGGESAAAVKLLLEAEVTRSTEKDNAHDSDISTINEKLGGIEAGAQVNKIESVAAKVGAKIVVTTTEKAVEIDDSAIIALIGTAQSKADSAYEEAGKNKTALETLSGTVSNNKTAQDAIAGRVSALETTDTDYSGRISKLETDILDKASTKSVSDINETLVNRISPLETDNTNNKAAISALQGTVGGHSTLLADLDGTSTVKALITDAKKAGTDAAAAAEEAKSLVSALETGKVATNTESIENLGGRLITVEDNVAALQGQIGGLTGAMHFRGTSTTDPMGENGPSVEGVESYASGDVVLYDGKEYIYDGSKWSIFGDEGSYALKATTLAGYGITDAYTKTETDAAITAAMSWNDIE